MFFLQFDHVLQLVRSEIYKYYAKYEGIVGDSVSNSVMQKIATYKKKINVGNL